MNSYIFTSERLGFRNWNLTDLDILTELNNDAEVMEFFPFKPSQEQTKEFIIRMQKMCSEYDFCYYAVELLETRELIGFIGLCEQTYLEDLGNFVDIGWRLKKTAWGKGYATEGANACLKYAFNELKLTQIYSVAPEINLGSIAVMKKIGMKFLYSFKHPKLLNNKRLVNCVLYQIEN